MFLSDKEVARRFGVSRSTIWRWVREDRVPTPKRLTRGSTRWRLEDVEAWAASATETAA